MSGVRSGVAVVGARGYSGLELVRILLKHPQAKITACFATDSNFSLSDYLPEPDAANINVLPMTQLEATANETEVFFLATPAEVSLELAPKLLAAGAKVIDLSGAFRLNAAEYPKWYGFEHSHPELLAQAVYGLIPWMKPHASNLVANPGCYATSVLMAVLPLLKHDLIDSTSLVIDAKSGTTGAGRKASESLLFTEVEGECLPYRIGKHQHFPEICGRALHFAGQAIDPMFSTNLMPVRRGIISSIYAHLRSSVTASDVKRAFTDCYESYPLVRIDEMNDRNMSLKTVVGSARTHIRYKIDGKKLYAFSMIDNLLKGAASQAIENFNAMSDLPVGTGLIDKEGVL